MKPDEIYRSLNEVYFSDEAHEEEIIRSLPKLMKRVRLFVDVGASLGQYTKVANQHLRGARIVAIEADPVRAAELERNCASWQKQSSNRITALGAVVSDVDGQETFHTTNSPVSGGLFEREISADDEIKWESVEIQSIQLNTYLRGETPDLVKIDVEGAELRVLKGARSWLERGRTDFLVEVHSWGDKKRGTGPTEVFELIRCYGYFAIAFYGHWYFTRSPLRAVRAARLGGSSLLGILSRQIRRHLKLGKR